GEHPHPQGRARAGLRRLRRQNFQRVEGEQAALHAGTGGRIVRVNELPAAVMTKLLILDQVAGEFAATAQAAEQRLARARDIVNGKREVDVEDYQRERDGFDATFGAAKMAASYAESARKVLAHCRAWLAALPADSKLLLVQPAAADLDLAAL